MPNLAGFGQQSALFRRRRSGTGVGFKKNGINLLSQRTGSVKVTVTFVCPDGKEVRDTITITFQ